MSNWNDLSRDRLIKEYRKFACLWSTKDGDAKNAEKRRECLCKITAELNKYEEKPFTQEEVRTQFKNLRDMYRRKRKKLQLQHELSNSVDEPGWVYFSRLKFLDDSIDFSPPNESPPPPAKKKGKVAQKRPHDDASLPTPLEESSTANTTVICPPQQSGMAEAFVAMESKPVKGEISPAVDVQFEPDKGRESNAPPRTTEPERAESSSSSSTREETAEKRTATGESQQKHQSTSCEALLRIAADPLPNGNSGVELRGALEDEFTCFGRFVAMTLRKISSRSAVDALEARKDIGEVLYRKELDSLNR